MSLAATDFERVAGLRLPASFRAMPPLDQIQWLNDAYREQPVHPAPPARTEQGFMRTAASRLDLIPRRINLDGAAVLEIGCGTGHFAEVAASRASRYVGVDIQSHPNWESAASKYSNVEFHEVDLAVNQQFQEATFDVIVSWVVWEHVRRPVSMLKAARRLLRPGGYLIFKANVFTSAIASHLYRDIFFPWPHLIFQDRDLIDYVRRKWAAEGGTSATQRSEEEFPEPCLYVNRLALAHYLKYFQIQRWHLLHLKKDLRPIDESFYAAFESELGRYPRSDLSLDFFTAALRKPKSDRAYIFKEAACRVVDKVFGRLF